MATTSQDNIQLRVVIDGSPARKELAQVNQDLVKLKETQKQLVSEQRALNEARKAAKANGDTAEVQRLNKVMEQNRQKLTELNQAVTQHGTKQQELRNQIGDTALSFSELRNKAQALQSALSKAVPNTPEARKLAAELFVLQERMKEVGGTVGVQAQAWEHLRKGLKVTEMSMRQLQMESTRLKTALDKTKPNTPEFRQLSSELQTVDRRMNTLRTGLGPFGQAWANVKGQILGATAILGTFFAGGAIINMFGGMIKSSAELSDAIADVRRTTGLTTAQVEAMVSEFKNMDTRTPRAELMALAADAGKLGISAEQDVMAFVKAGDQLRVALGDELGDDAIKNIGKLVDLFRLKEQFGLEESMLKVGSTLNELGMSSTASEGYMVEFLKRMGGIAPLAGITIDQTLALGATLDSLGQTSEVSSTALSKMFIQMAQDAEQYARIAGMSVEKFEQLMSVNALDAFMAVLEGSKETEGGIIALTETLGNMGVDGSRAAGVFGALANNTDVLAKQLQIAAGAFEEGSSITDEFRIKNETLAASLAKMQQEIYRTFITTGLVDILKEWVAQFRELMDWVRRNGDTLKVFGQVLLAVGTAFVTYKAVILATSVATRTGMALTAAWTTLKMLFTSSMARAVVAMQAFNTATKLNPIGLLLGVISAAVVAMNAFSASTKAAADAASSETTKLQILHQQILATNKGSEERRKLVEQLKAQYPEYLGQLNADTASNEDLALSIAKVNKMLINKALLEAKDGALEEQNSRVAQERIKLYEAERNAQELIALAVKETGVVLKEGTLAQQATQVLAVEGSKKVGLLTRMELNRSLQLVREYTMNAEREEAKSAEMLAERQDTMKRFGITAEETADKTQAAARSLADVNVEITQLETILSNPKAQSGADVEATQARLNSLYAVKDALMQVKDAALTLEQIEEAISAKQAERKKTSTTNAEYLVITKEITELERQKAAIEGVAKAGIQANAKAVEDLTAIERAMAEFHERMYQLTLTSDERELRELDVRHQDEMDKLLEHQAKLVAAKKMTPEEASTNVYTLESAQFDAYFHVIAGQEERRFNAVYDAQQRIKQLISESNSLELRDKVAHYDALIDEARHNGLSTLQLERERHAAIMDFREQEELDVIAAEMQKWQELMDLARSQGIDTAQLVEARGRAESAIHKRWEDQKVQDTVDAEQKIREARVKGLRDFSELANSFNGLLQGITSYMDAGVRMAEQQADADQDRTEAEIANINRLKKERRDAALVALAVQGASAIANGVASAMANPVWYVGVAQALSTAGIVLGLMAQARALMNEGGTSSDSTSGDDASNLNNIPLGEKGMAYMADGGSTGNGRVRRVAGMVTSDTGGGVLPGSLHRDGGNVLYDTRTGQPLAEVERDELMLVLSRKATAANADLIPSMLEASRKGERMPIFQREVPMPNPTKVGQAMRVVHMAAGGAFAATEEQNALAGRPARGTALVNLGTNPDDPTTKHILALLERIATESAATRHAAQNFPKELTATTSIREGERRKVEYDHIQRLNQGRRA